MPTDKHAIRITQGDKVKSETFGVQFDRSVFLPAEQELVSRSTNPFDEGLGILLLQLKKSDEYS